MSEPKLFHLEIITPQQVIFSGEVIDFAAPGVMGGFEILKNHADFISAMTIGEIRVREADGYDDFFATSGGYVDVHGNIVTVLAETCEKASDIDINLAKEEHEKALKRMEERANIDMEPVRLALLRAQNRIEIASKRLKNNH